MAGPRRRRLAREHPARVAAEAQAKAAAEQQAAEAEAARVAAETAAAEAAAKAAAEKAATEKAAHDRAVAKAELIASRAKAADAAQQRHVLEAIGVIVLIAAVVAFVIQHRRRPAAR